jgi:hypothetical protein
MVPFFVRFSLVERYLSFFLKVVLISVLQCFLLLLFLHDSFSSDDTQIIKTNDCKPSEHSSGTIYKETYNELHPLRININLPATHKTETNTQNCINKETEKPLAKSNWDIIPTISTYTK